MEVLKLLKTAIILLLIFTLITGFIYPIVVTGVAQFLFPFQANGSLIKYHDKWIGSALIGQSFTDEAYFWGRPSPTQPFPYNAENSSGANMGPSNPDFLPMVKMRIALLQKNNPDKARMIPIDLITASGSGLDPEISPLAATYQAERIAKARKLDKEKILLLIQKLTKNRYLSVLGEPRINVLQLNLALDKL
ncbi:MAG: kdpC [Gammaproteobacteria bacterium]|jgi:K+-transporting ATPase ATPase C chain|nr:kdpC [Gammaproteobacteria bacterium]